MSTWNASNYRQRKAARLATVKPEWIINPDTGEEFYLRKVGGLMSSVLAGYMPSGLTAEAVEAWKEKGVEGLEDPNSISDMAAKLSPEQREAGEQETRTLSQIVQQMCVIPFLSNQLASEVTFTDEWKSAAIAGMKEKDPNFDAEKFDFKELVFDPKELDDRDTVFLFKWARGLAGGVAMKGGNVVSAGNFSALRKKPGRSPRASAGKSEIRQAS